MKIRRVTIEVEVPWDATYETTPLPKKMDGDGILYVLKRGMDEVYDLTGFPHQAQVVKEEVSPNTQIGVFAKWPPQR